MPQNASRVQAGTHTSDPQFPTALDASKMLLFSNFFLRVQRNPSCPDRPSIYATNSHSKDV
jgi:hypothetical protein